MEAFAEILSASENRTANESKACDDSMRSTVNMVKAISTASAVYLIPVVSVIGLLSNAMVCAVVIRRKNDIGDRGRTMYGAIAAADSLQILVNSVGRVFFTYGLKSTLGLPNIELCRLHAFLSSLTMGLSNSFAACFAVERCLSVYKIELSRSARVHLHLRLALLVLSVIQAFAAVPFFWILDLPARDGRPTRRLCEFIPSDSAFVDIAFTIKMLCTAYLPCLLLFTSDVALLVFLVRRRRRPLLSMDTNRMRAIINSTKACVVISTLRCALLISCIGVIQGYYVVLKYDGGSDPDHCVADLLQALSVLFFSASVLVLSSNFYVLLWRVRPFKAAFRRMWQRKASSETQIELETQSNKLLPVSIIS